MLNFEELRAGKPVVGTFLSVKALLLTLQLLDCRLPLLPVNTP